MKINVGLLFLTFGLVLCSVSCRTDRCKDSKCAYINKIDSEFARYWDFKKGSYWVYQLASDTNEVDTVIVYRATQAINDACVIGGEPCTELKKFFLQHSNYKYFQKSGFKAPKSFEYFTSGSYGTILRMPGDIDTYSGADVLKFNIDNSKRSDMSWRDSNLINVRNSRYSSVAHLETNKDTSIYKKIYLHQWWVKDVGLVKFALSGNLVWELKEYHIEK